ncbi:MAG: restriction endonuclease subunit S [Ignavibacteriae bacterium]|nr:restriction endonuclease subunit S [Ignavibacteriota bacterium]
METRNIIIGNVCKLNSETLSTPNAPLIIRYLDTSSITKNKIEDIQLLDSSLAPFPSRAKRKVKKGTIIYSTVRPNLEHYGYLDNPEENLIVSTGFLTIDVIDKEIDSKFLYYSITRKHITDYLHTIAANNVSSYPSINPDDLGNLELEIPNDKSKQQKIASVLSSLDSKIELNNRINAELEAMAKTLYDYWFVQFDFPDKNGKPYKSTGGKMLFNKELKREIPDGWKNGTLGDYANLKGGFAFKSSWWSEQGIPVIKIKDINEDYTLSINNCSFVSEDKRDIAKNYEAHPGDIVIAMTGATVGKYGIVPKTGSSILVNQRVGLFNLGKNPILKLPFLINSLKQDYFRKTIFVIASGAAQPNISSDQIDAIPLMIPETIIVDLFNSKLLCFYEKMINNIAENQKLAELRDWLLPMLMNGQVKVT